jgi:signal transduction histidine kinase
VIDNSNYSPLSKDLSMGWKQFNKIFESQTAQAMKFNQFLLFEFGQNHKASLELRAATGIQPRKTIISADSILQTELDKVSGIWYSGDISRPTDCMQPLISYIVELGGKSAIIGRVNNNAHIWGVLVGYSDKCRIFDRNELSVFSLLTDCVTLLVDNIQLRLGVAFRISEALSLETVSSSLVESGSVDQTLTLIVDEAVRLLHAQDALVLLLEEDGEWFQVRERTGNNVASTYNHMSVKNSLNGKVVMNGEPLISPDAQTDPNADQARAVGLNVRSVIIAPLKIRQRTIGTIAVHNKLDGNFTQDDLKVLCSYANQVAIAIDNAQLFSDLVIARNEIQQKAQELQELLAQTMNIQETERHRIAADLHDRVISQIVGALYAVESCASNRGNLLEIEQQLHLLKQLLNEAIEQIRASVYNMWPATLDHMGLLPALNELFKRQQLITGLPHTIHVRGKLDTLNPTAQIAIFRIVQEAVNNAFQHAAASSINMSIYSSPKHVSIKIYDDGQGFDVERIMQSPLACHFGLLGMRERASSVGGSLMVKSETGKGTQVILEIPSKEIFFIERM